MRIWKLFAQWWLSSLSETKEIKITHHLPKSHFKKVSFDGKKCCRWYCYKTSTFQAIEWSILLKGYISNKSNMWINWQKKHENQLWENKCNNLYSNINSKILHYWEIFTKEILIIKLKIFQVNIWPHFRSNLSLACERTTCKPVYSGFAI